MTGFFDSVTNFTYFESSLLVSSSQRYFLNEFNIESEFFEKFKIIFKKNS
jgi:hypothetical protein